MASPSPSTGACAGDYFPKEVMGTVIGAWTPFYGAGAILVHWVSGVLRDTTGSYDQAFMINAVMAAIGIGLICLVQKRSKLELNHRGLASSARAVSLSANNLWKKLYPNTQILSRR